ncbi:MULTISPECIES: hypothetical protein [Streptomyces]|uniref:hypothetical protein n=1 Tax=Streptomyces TaxID=1883 RepID=UPI0033B5A9FD
MIDDLVDAAWDRELNDLFLRIGHRFGRIPWSAIRCSTLASCPSASATASLASTSLASCPARRALVRLSTSSRHARRRTPIPGSINHHTVEAISTAEPR